MQTTTRTGSGAPTDRRQLRAAGTALGLVSVSIMAGLLVGPGLAQSPPPAGLEGGAATPGSPAEMPAAGPAASMLHVPVTNLYPGTVPPGPEIENPNLDDPEAVNRGYHDFIQFNCVGCHAANGAGGMGPALSNSKFIYGDKPEQIFLTILQGRPKGMPAWGGMLPESVIWDLVAYIKSISAAPAAEWGKTTSLDAFAKAGEQVPAQKLQTTQPWNHTEPFSFGQRPTSEQKKLMQPEQQ